MEQFLSDNLTTIILAIIGITSAGIIIKKKSNKVIQKNNSVIGDMAARDVINKK